MKYKEELLKKDKELEETNYRNRLLQQQVEKCMAEKKAKEEEAKKRYSITLYCTNCMWVISVLIASGVSIKLADCTNCRVIGCLLPVVMYPGKV